MSHGFYCYLGEGFCLCFILCCFLLQSLSNPRALPDLYFYGSLWPVASTVIIRVRVSACVASLCMQSTGSIICIAALFDWYLMDVWRKWMLFYSFQGSIKNTIMALLFLFSHSNDRTMLWSAKMLTFKHVIIAIVLKWQITTLTNYYFKSEIYSFTHKRFPVVLILERRFPYSTTTPSDKQKNRAMKNSTWSRGWVSVNTYL